MRSATVHVLAEALDQAGVEYVAPMVEHPLAKEGTVLLSAPSEGAARAAVDAACDALLAKLAQLEPFVDATVGSQARATLALQ